MARKVHRSHFKPLSDNSCWNVWSFVPRLIMNTKREDFVIFLLRSTSWWFWQLWFCTTDLPDGQRSSVSADWRDEGACLNTCWLHRFVHWGLPFSHCISLFPSQQLLASIPCFMRQGFPFPLLIFNVSIIDLLKKCWPPFLADFTAFCSSSLSFRLSRSFCISWKWSPNFDIIWKQGGRNW